MRTSEISFIEQSKAVTTKVKLSGEGEVDIDGNNKALAEAIRLYEEARKFSSLKTFQKIRGN